MFRNPKLPTVLSENEGEIQNSETQKAYKISVRGDIQGVSYRYFAKKAATKLGLVGWATNKQDGTVEIFVQGDPEEVQEFIDWCKEGSPMATVEEVLVETAEPDNNLKNFEVR